MGSSVKIERFLTRRELPAFFRSLAQAMETEGQGEFPHLDRFHKLKLELKDEFGQLSLKMKATPKSDEAGPGQGEAGGVPKYKDLKKRMKAGFKLILGLIGEDELPPRAAVEAFLADSRRMITYPGHGDEYYEEYARTCQALEQAFQVGDLERVKAEVVSLANQKTRCHAKYD